MLEEGTLRNTRLSQRRGSTLFMTYPALQCVMTAWDSLSLTFSSSTFPSASPLLPGND